jgi:hypothetical protein
MQAMAASVGCHGLKLAVLEENLCHDHFERSLHNGGAIRLCFQALIVFDSLLCKSVSHFLSHHPVDPVVRAFEVCPDGLLLDCAVGAAAVLQSIPTLAAAATSQCFQASHGRVCH